MAICVLYQPEGSDHSFNTLQQAQMAEVLLGENTVYLEHYLLLSVVELLDKHFIITPRVPEKEKKDNETIRTVESY